MVEPTGKRTGIFLVLKASKAASTAPPVLRVTAFQTPVSHFKPLDRASAPGLHFIWAKTLSGRLGNGLSYSSNLSWNTFPLPQLTEQNKADLTRCAEDILLAREAHFPATIADLYDPETMPENLRAAHNRNDETLERIYLGRRFKNDTERLEKLFALYTEMTTKPTIAKPAGKPARVKKHEGYARQPAPTPRRLC